MIANIEALSALAELGTMTKAATRLRITQSAVSKRIAALEASTGACLIERIGRGVRLTPDGVALLEKTDPFMKALREALREDRPTGSARLEIGVSELRAAGRARGGLFAEHKVCRRAPRRVCFVAKNAH